MKICGRVWVFGDHVDTDVITPGKYLDNPAELRKHIFEALDRDFPSQVRRGDLIVAGRNFGCGSSRESAPEELKHVGIAAVVAESFSRIFFRNAIAIGLPVLECPGISKHFRKFDQAEIDLAAFSVKNLSTGVELNANPIPAQLVEILNQGGLLNILYQQAKQLKR